MRVDELPKSLFYICHIDTVPSILSNGILSRNRAIAERRLLRSVDDKKVNDIRKNKIVEGTRSLHDYVPVYLSLPAPMFLRLVLGGKFNEEDLAFIEIDCTRAFNDISIYIADGNAASHGTKIVKGKGGLEGVDSKALYHSDDFKKSGDEWKRKKSAELLISDFLPTDWILGARVVNEDVLEKLKSELDGSLWEKFKSSIKVADHMFHR